MRNFFCALFLLLGLVGLMVSFPLAIVSGVVALIILFYRENPEDKKDREKYAASLKPFPWQRN